MWKMYRKNALQKMRPYVPGEDMSNISVSAVDTPEPGGMIAVSSDDPYDKWYVSRDFFDSKYEVAE